MLSEFEKTSSGVFIYRNWLGSIPYPAVAPESTRLFFIGGDVGEITIQNTAQHIQGIGAYIGVFSQPVQLTGADSVFLNQFVLRDIFVF